MVQERTGATRSGFVSVGSAQSLHRVALLDEKIRNEEQKADKCKCAAG